MNLIQFFRSYWKSVFLLCWILYLSFAPPSTFNKIPTFEFKNIDKIVHLIMYTGLSFVLILDYYHQKKHNIHRTTFVLVCLVFPAILGGIIEIMQGAFFAPRTASWFDWYFDIFGVILGWIIVLLTKIVNIKIFKVR